MNPFKRPYAPSIFNDSYGDSKMDIPNNRELFEVVIKETFEDFLVSEEKKEPLTDDEMVSIIRKKFIKHAMKGNTNK